MPKGTALPWVWHVPWSKWQDPKLQGTETGMALPTSMLLRYLSLLTRTMLPLATAQQAMRGRARWREGQELIRASKLMIVLSPSPRGAGAALKQGR